MTGTADRPRKIARIKDVALVAGVSTATVSRALSNPTLLSEESRKAVFEAIRATGYRTNHAARNLRQQRAGAVLVLVPNLSNTFFSQILAGINLALEATDYSILIADSARPDASHSLENKRIANYFSDSRIDGMVALDGGLSTDGLEQFSPDIADKIVFACEWIPGEVFPSVRSDNVKGAQLAIRHLHALGHRRIAHITGPRGNVLTRARRDSIAPERHRLDLPAREGWIIHGDFSMRAGHRAAADICAMKERPTAVFCASDETALGLISGLHHHGIRVPEDISVVGFDDIELAEHYLPALTTIRQDRKALGRRAAELLLDRLRAQGPSAQGQVDTLDVELVVRGSTAAPKS